MARPKLARGPQTELCKLMVPSDLAERLERLAVASDQSQAWIRRRALIEYLSRAETVFAEGNG